MMSGSSPLSGANWDHAALWLFGAVLLSLGVFFIAGLGTGPVLAADDGDRSYEIVKVDQQVTVEPSGTLEVVESRTFDFDGSFNGVYWKLPTGYNTNNGQDVKVEVESATAQVRGSSAHAKLVLGQASQGGYTVEDSTSDNGAPIKKVTLYQGAADTKVVFTLTYRISGVVTNWQNTAELYWKYVSDGWEAASQNVTCTIYLPEAAQSPRAWGHGPLDGSVKVDKNKVTIFSPVVGGADFAEARVLFDKAAVPLAPAPAANISNPADKSEQIVAEEQAWADQANQKRALAQYVFVALAVSGVVVAIGARLLLSMRWRCWRKTHTPTFTDTYFRDVPREAEPAVLGALYFQNEARPQHLTSELMDLSQRRIVELKLDQAHAADKGEWRLTQLGEGTTAVERLALELAFCNAGTDDKGRATVKLSHMTKGSRARVAKAFENWEAELAAQVQSKFADSGKDRAFAQAIASIVGVLAVCASGALGFLIGGTLSLSANPWILAALLAWFFALVAGVFLGVAYASAMHALNQEGIDTLAKLQALRRWLLEFTLLDEAVPQDLALWDRLLVMAVALGVSREVIKQLKVVFPDAFAEKSLDAYPYFYSYLWLNSYHGNSPLSSVDNASKHYVASAAAVAASSGSSGGGFGGGFSGGGGGGFGGGGGGGAF